MANLLETGEVITTHGIKGEIKVYPWADSPEQLLAYKKITIDNIEYAVERARVQPPCVIMKLKDINRIEDAEKLKGKTIYFDRTVYKPKKGHYIADLVGISVFSEGNEIGTLHEVLQMPGNDVWVVKGEKEYMIPSVPAFILSVDIDHKRADVRLLEGMASDEN